MLGNANFKYVPCINAFVYVDLVNFSTCSFVSVLSYYITDCEVFTSQNAHY